MQEIGQKSHNDERDDPIAATKPCFYKEIKASND